MAIDNRLGTCSVCAGAIQKVPYPALDVPDRWVHRDPADWRDNPHEATPQEDNA